MNKVCVGIDLGGTTVKLGVCEMDGKVVREAERPTPKGPYREALERLQPMVSDLLSQSGLSMRQVVGVGVGVPALYNQKTGRAYEVVNLGWKDAPLKEDLERILGAPCYVDNDANVAALGEFWRGAGRGVFNLVCATVGTGIGGGLILNGDIYRGALGLAGEIGHLKVRPGDGRRCNCGGIGCLETEASASAIVHYALEAARAGKSTALRRIFNATGALSAKDAIDAAKAGDEVAFAIVRQATRYLSLGLAHLANALNPEKIIIGGGVSQAGSFFIDLIRTEFRRFALKKVAETTAISPAELGNAAGWIGAAWLARRNFKQGGGK